MKPSPLLLVALALEPLALPGAVSDTTPPSLEGLGFSATSVDTTDGAQLVTISFRVTDDLGGTSSFGGRLRRVGAPVDAASLSFGASRFLPLVAPEQLRLFEGSATLTIPRGCPPGTWVLAEVSVQDTLRNARRLGETELAAAGLSAELRVTGPGDVAAPEVVALSVSPRVVDTTDGPATVLVSVRVRDSGAGMDSLPGVPFSAGIAMGFSGPQSRHRVSVSLGSAQRASGDALDGVYTNWVVIPRFSETGTWTLAGGTATDAVGNAYRWDGFHELARRAEATFTVSGRVDVQPPTLHAMTVNRRQVDASDGGQSVACALWISDDLAGLGGSMLDPQGRPYLLSVAGLGFRSPSRSQSVSTGFNGSHRTRTDPSGAEIFTNLMVFPRYSETGIWMLEGITCTDTAGNTLTVTLADAERLGIPTTLAVGVAPRLEIRRFEGALALGWPGWGAEFVLESSDPGRGMPSWEPWGSLPVTIVSEVVVALPANGGQRLFRLRRP